MHDNKFAQYIDFLKENLSNVVEYRERTGRFDPKFSQVRDDLFHEDPFIVFGASMLATVMLNDKTLYH